MFTYVMRSMCGCGCVYLCVDVGSGNVRVELLQHAEKSCMYVCLMYLCTYVCLHGMYVCVCLTSREEMKSLSLSALFSFFKVGNTGVCVCVCESRERERVVLLGVC